MQLRKKKGEKFRISKLKTLGKQIGIQTSPIWLNMVTTVFMHLQAEGEETPFFLCTNKYCWINRLLWAQEN